MIPSRINARLNVYLDGERINGEDTTTDVYTIDYNYVSEVHIRTRAKTLEQGWFGHERLPVAAELDRQWHRPGAGRRWYIHVAARDHNDQLVHLSPGVAAREPIL